MIQNERVPRTGLTARQNVARDTLVILGAAVLAILVGRLAVPDLGATAPSAEPPGGSAVVVGMQSDGPEVTVPPLATLGPVVNASAGLAATPTPIPIITLGPPTPTPSIEPSVGPTASIKATPKPTVKPTPTPTPKPTPKPTPTPPPIVLASFTCTYLGSNQMSFTDTSSGNPTQWQWNFGDLSGGTSTLQNPTYSYSSGIGDYTVTLTVTGPGGTDTAHQTCSVTS